MIRLAHPFLAYSPSSAVVAVPCACGEFGFGPLVYVVIGSGWVPGPITRTCAGPRSTGSHGQVGHGASARYPLDEQPERYSTLTSARGSAVLSRAVIAPPHRWLLQEHMRRTCEWRCHTESTNHDPTSLIKDEHHRPAPRRRQETARQKTIQKLQHSHTASEAQTWACDKATSDNQNQTLKQHI